MDKQTDAQQVVRQLHDGMTIGIGGWGPRRKPMALLREILRSDLQDLTIVSYGGADVGMLCAAGKVKKLIFAFVSLDIVPLEPFFRQARENGAIEILELDEGMLLLGLRCAAWGCPFIPTRVGLGTDIITGNSELAVIGSPYDDKEWVAMPALSLDVALIHTECADVRGVCQIKASDHYMDDWFARAAKKTYVSCEQLVASDYFAQQDHARYVWWERSVTSGVVHMPGGAHPGSCAPYYGVDKTHLKEYCNFAKHEGFAAYMDKYIEGKSESDYRQLVGGLEVIFSLPQPVY